MRGTADPAAGIRVQPVTPRPAQANRAGMDPLAARFVRFRVQGDLGALGEVFDRTAPKLLALALHLCGEPADAEDALQQTFLRAMRQASAFDAARPLEPWLAGLLGNVVRELRRREARRTVEPLPELASGDSGPQAVAERSELVATLRQHVDALPAEQRQVLLLQLQHGLSPVEIAEVLGAPPGTVRMRIHRGLASLRRLLPATLCAAWFGSLPARGLAAVRCAVLEVGGQQVAAATASGALAQATTWLFGGILMKKVAIGLFMAAVAIGFAVLAWSPAVQGPPVPEQSPPPVPDPVTAAVEAASAPSPAPAPTVQRELVAAPTASGRGDLVVHLLYDDRSPAADVMLTAFRRNEIPRTSLAPSVDAKRRRTDANGIARFPSMRAGRTGLVTDRGHWFEKAHVVAGQETEVEFVMPVGVTVSGIVVSAAGAPMAGAQVDLEGNPVAITDMQGSFTIRAAAEEYGIGACAEGHGPSRTQHLLSHDGRAEVRLELGAAGGIVEGVVLDADGRPLPELRVTIGRYEGGASWLGDAPPRPARVLTDGDGRFRAIGIAAGEQQVSARAPGCLPWTGTCQVVADATANVAIALLRGNTLRGMLRDADGKPFGDVLIGARAGKLDWDEVIHPDGTFAIDGLPDGEIELKVDAEGQGRAQARVTMLPGGVTTCELQLERGLVVKGKVRDEQGQPLPQVNIRWQPSPSPLDGYTFTDKEGAFTIVNAPDAKLAITIDGDAIISKRFEDIDPHAGELDLRAQHLPAKSVYLAGVVLGPDGRPAAARVWASGGGSQDMIEKVTDAAGFFEVGPVCPGDWQLFIQSRSFPSLWLQRKGLAANSRWDAGEIHLSAGGDVRVEVQDGDVEAVLFSIVSDEQHWFALRTEHGKGSSEMLPVGGYRLLVSGKELAAQSISFAIRAGETTKLDVRVRPGVRQRFELALPAKPDKQSASLRIVRGAGLVARTWASREAGKPCIAEVWLEAGDYTVTATCGELEGSAAFTVGGREGDPVRIVVPE